MRENIMRDYKIIFTSEGDIANLPEAQSFFELLCNILAAKGGHKSGCDRSIQMTVVFSCVMPENTIIKPLIPFDFGKRTIEKVNYPIIKKLKKINYISEAIIAFASKKDFYGHALDKISSKEWEIKNDVLTTAYDRDDYLLTEYIKTIREEVNGEFVTKSKRLLNTNQSRFQILIKTEINDIREVLHPNKTLDMGMYNRYKIISIEEIHLTKSKLGILISKYCPISISDEIDIENSYLRVAVKDGVQYIMEGSLICPKPQFSGGSIKNEMRNSKLNGKGFIYYI